ncbi:hypothetical protein [uncultured Caulobacter sp.]|uniref:hypothetical protein n=1 Tax=uncultured Caulobacter sp. TaxID=158749 RepID=UPI002615DC31|nr:hypothetical protein [uncultured Caulobacter sp.]
MARKTKTSNDDWRAPLALALVETAVRNSRLEELHAGVSPESAVGDYSDVTVVTPYGEIPWARLSRLDDAEMKALMIEVVDRVYTVLTHPEPFMTLMGARAWNQPALDPAMMDAVARHEAKGRGVSREEIWRAWPLDEGKQRPPLRREAIAAAHQDQDAADGDEPDVTLAPAAPITPEAMRRLAEVPVADAGWIARVREALRAGAAEWEHAELERLDEIEAATHCRG